MNGLEPPIPGLLYAGGILAVLCALECWAFVWMYRKVDKTPEGRHLFRLSFLLGLTFSATVIFQFVPEHYLFKATMQLIIFSAIVAELWVRIMLLRTNQRLARAALKAQREADDAELEERRAEDSQPTNGPS